MKGKLISLVTLFLCMMGSLLLHAQSVQQGKVLEYQGSAPKTPLAGVSIAAKGAAAVQSNAEGQFSLDLRTHHAGDAIQFRRVELNGYEVMNQEALEVARVARKSPSGGDLEGLSIVMIKRETLKKLRDGYRSVAAQRYEQQLKASTEEIERLKKAGQLAEEQYNERMNALEEAYEDKLTKLETYIDKFARIDLSDLDQDELQIIDLVQAGNFDEALDLYDKQNLADRLRKSREDQQKLVAMRDQLSDAAQKKAMENERLRQSIDRQITLLMMAGGEENLMKVHNLYHQVYLADTTHVMSRVDYATSLVQHNMTQEAINLMKSGIASTTDSLSLGVMYNELFYCQYEISQFKEALSSIRNADKILQPLWDKHPIVRSRYMPSVFYFYLLSQDLADEKEIESIVERSVSQWDPDTLNVGSVDKYALLLNKLSEYYMMTANHEKSIWAAQEGLKLGEVYQRKWPWTSMYWQNCAFACSTVAIEGMHLEVVQTASNYIHLLQPVLKSWSSTSKILNVCDNSFYVLEALEMHKEYALADTLITLLDQWNVMQTVEKRYPGKMDEIIGRYNLTVSYILLAQGKVDEAEKLAVESCDKIASTEIGAYYIGHMRPGAMGRIRLAQGKYQEAIALYQEAIAQSKAIYDADPNDFDADTVCRYYIDLLELYKAQGDLKSLKNTLKQAAKYATFEYDRQMINKFKN